jgi:uncharacterized protein (TIGR02270 family)
MNAPSRPAVEVVLSQHLEDAISLRTTRGMLVHAPHVALRHLARADERLAAHLDGLSVGGDAARAMARAALEVPGVGQLFVCSVLAIEQHDSAQIEKMLALVPVVPDAWRALSSAFGWVSSSQLRGFTAALLGSPSASARRLGLAACAQHRVDPGAPLAAAIADADPALSMSAIRFAGVLGRADLLPACIARLDDPNPSIAGVAAGAAWLLGERTRSAEALQRCALTASPLQPESLRVALLGADPNGARALIQRLVAATASPRLAIRAAGWAGDPQVMPWLLKQMENPTLSRIAGEAFTFITGADLAELDLDGPQPERTPGEPTDEPEDAEVSLDEDYGLPYPRLELVQAWWMQHCALFPPGQRVLVGRPPTPAHCLHVLREGTQRQRIAAALTRALQQPGSPVFNCAASARRQQHQLDALESA